MLPLNSILRIFFKSLFYFCICRTCYDFTRFNLLRIAVSFKQIMNCITLLIAFLEIHHLQNTHACEVKTTEQTGFKSILTWENPKKWMCPIIPDKFHYFERQFRMLNSSSISGRPRAKFFIFTLRPILKFNFHFGMVRGLRQKSLARLNFQ